MRVDGLDVQCSVAGMTCVPSIAWSSVCVEYCVFVCL